MSEIGKVVSVAIMFLILGMCIGKMMLYHVDYESKEMIIIDGEKTTTTTITTIKNGKKTVQMYTEQS